jgi:hypothetical protein
MPGTVERKTRGLLSRANCTVSSGSRAGGASLLGKKRKARPSLRNKVSDMPIRPFNRLADYYLSCFEGESLLFGIEKREFQTALSFLPKPWMKLEPEPKGDGPFWKGAAVPDLTAFPWNWIIDSLERRKERMAFSPQGMGSIIFIVPPCLAWRTNQLLQYSHQALKPQAKMALGFIPCNSPWRIFLEKKKKLGIASGKGGRFYSLEEMEQLFIQAGFSLQDLFSTLFQKPEGTRALEIAMRGYHPGAGFLLLIGEKTH